MYTPQAITHTHTPTMSSSYVSFPYQKLKKFPDRPNQECLGVANGRLRWRRRWSWRLDGGGARRRRPPLRISRLTKVLRRKATVLGDKVRGSVRKVVRRFKEGRPYIGDLFAGNYVFLQVTPSPTMGTFEKGGYLPLPLGYYQDGKKALHLHHSHGVLYKV